MCVLIGNTVKTQYADYPCATREEAEALFIRLRERERERSGQPEPRPDESPRDTARAK